MKDGPAIAQVAALFGDPARANIMTALMAGKALTLSELAQEAGILLPTASAHITKLLDGGLVAVRKQGRHKYVALASPSVAETIEALMALAADRGHLRTRTGPRDASLRAARRCYHHLAGAAGVRLYESMARRDYLAIAPIGLHLTAPGQEFVTGLGIDAAQLSAGRSPLCRECLDWSERRSHLGGRLGRALFDHMIAAGWAVQSPQSRVVSFTERGRKLFQVAFPAD